MPGGRPQLFDINSSVLNLILNAFALKLLAYQSYNEKFFLNLAVQN